MTKPVTIPRWAANITADIALPHLPEPVQDMVKPFSGQPLSVIWKRLNNQARTAIESWGKSCFLN